MINFFPMVYRYKANAKCEKSYNWFTFLKNRDTLSDHLSWLQYFDSLLLLSSAMKLRFHKKKHMFSTQIISSQEET